MTENTYPKMHAKLFSHKNAFFHTKFNECNSYLKMTFAYLVAYVYMQQGTVILTLFQKSEL